MTNNTNSMKAQNYNLNIKGRIENEMAREPNKNHRLVCKLRLSLKKHRVNNLGD